MEGLPITWEKLWFSSTTTITWSGVGRVLPLPEPPPPKLELRLPPPQPENVRAVKQNRAKRRKVEGERSMRRYFLTPGLNERPVEEALKIALRVLRCDYSGVRYSESSGRSFRPAANHCSSAHIQPQSALIRGSLRRYFIFYADSLDLARHIDAHFLRRLAPVDSLDPLRLGNQWSDSDLLVQPLEETHWNSEDCC
jgi:hypothetical protein